MEFSPIRSTICSHACTGSTPCCAFTFCRKRRTTSPSPTMNRPSTVVSTCRAAGGPVCIAARTGWLYPEDTHAAHPWPQATTRVEVIPVMYDGDNWMWHSGWSGWVLMTVLMVVFWAVAITLVVMAIRYLSNGRVHSAGPTASQAQVLLANRYARG